MTNTLTIFTGITLLFSATLSKADNLSQDNPPGTQIASNQPLTSTVSAMMPMDNNPMVDLVLVKKRERTLTLMSNGVPFRVYSIALGDDPIGHKQFEGDERTPEGKYTLDWRNPNSHYYKSIHVSYPNTADTAFAESKGKSPGGMIMIHGWPNRMKSWMTANWLLNEDWTDGCIALTNTAMEEVWNLVADGTPILIKP